MAKFNEEDINVVRFVEDINAQRADICENKTIINDLGEFLELYNDVRSLTDEYSGIYNEYEDEKSKVDLEEYLKYELDYLNLINELLDKLNTNIAQNKGLPDNEKDSDLNKAFENVRTLVIHQDFERRIEEIKKTVGKDYESDSTYQNLIAKMKLIEPKVAIATKTLLSDYSVSTDTHPIIIKDDDILNSNDIENSINYVTNMLEKIENVPGNDKIDINYNGKTIKINKEYEAEYLRYRCILDNLLKKLAVQGEKFSKNIEYSLSNYFEKIKRNASEVTSTNTLSEVDEKEEEEKRGDEVKQILASSNSSVTTDIDNDPLLSQLKVSQKFLDELMASFQEDDVIDTHFSEEKDEEALSKELESYSVEVQKYIEDSDKIIDILKQMEALEIRRTTVSSDSIETIVLPNNKAINILATNKPTYDRLYNEYLKCANNINSNIIYDESKENIMRNLKFLIRYGKRDKKTIEEIQSQYNMYKSIKKTEHLRHITMVIDILKIAGVSKSNLKYYKEAIIDPFSFAKNKRYKDEDKKRFLDNCRDEVFTAKTIADTNEVEGLKKVQYKKIKSANNNTTLITHTKEDISASCEEIDNTVSKVINTFGDKNKKTYKIKNKKKSINKVSLAEKLKKRVIRSAFILMLGGILLVNAKGGINMPKGLFKGAIIDNPNQIEKEIKMDSQSIDVKITKDIDMEKIAREIYNRANINKTQKQEQEEVKNTEKIDNKEEEYHIDLNDTFKPVEGAPIYSNYMDAALEQNGLKSTIPSDKQLGNSGIAYDYNGNIVWLSQSDPDFAAKREAYINNGAKEVVVRIDGNLGFYNIDDINIEGRSK